MQNLINKNYPKSNVQKEKRRVIFMGSAQTGKTYIIMNYLHKKYRDEHNQIREKMIVIDYYAPDGSSLKLEIVDTSGSYISPALRELSIITSDIFILVYAVDDIDSWINVINLSKQILKQHRSGVPIIIVGNKIDLLDSELEEEHKNANTITHNGWNSVFVGCSAKLNKGVIKVFNQALKQADISYSVVQRYQSLLEFFPIEDTESSACSAYIMRRKSY